MSAYLSDDRVYRYSLTRQFLPVGRDGTVTFIMLNPSIADEYADDPTVRRCMGFAVWWGFATLKVVNLYAYRATSPGELLDTDDPVGPENDCTIAKVVGASDLVVCAWGAYAHPQPDRVEKVLALVAAPHALKLTVQGFPQHPLFVKGETMPIPFAHCPPEAAWSLNARAESSEAAQATERAEASAS